MAPAELHLRDYGYSASLPEQRRHTVLRMAAEEVGWDVVEQRLRSIANIHGRPEIANLFEDDANYVARVAPRVNDCESKCCKKCKCPCRAGGNLLFRLGLAATIFMIIRKL